MELKKAFHLGSEWKIFCNLKLFLINAKTIRSSSGFTILLCAILATPFCIGS